MLKVETKGGIENVRKTSLSVNKVRHRSSDKDEMIPEALKAELDSLLSQIVEVDGYCIEGAVKIGFLADKTTSNVGAGAAAEETATASVDSTRPIETSVPSSGPDGS